MFKLIAPYEPAGDQPQAIEKLVQGLLAGKKHQVLLGVTGSGKTFTIANVIARVNRPTLVISHNKTLAAQLYAEFKSFFPYNAVEYFISYFDYYQPEAYLPPTDTYIEKDSSRNEEIERLRLSTLSSLMSRKDVIVVASVSCIYGIGDPEDFEELTVKIERSQEIPRDRFLAKLVSIHYRRNDISLEKGCFRVRGEIVEVHPPYSEDCIRIEFFGEEVERIVRFDPLTGRKLREEQLAIFYPAAQFVTPLNKIKRAILSIRQELEERVAWFEKQGKLLEAQRLRMRTEYDLEMLEETGYCHGIENYSRHLSGRPAGSRPYTLLDYMPDDYLLIIDESHVTVPQLRAMYNGDISRKQVLVDYGFRLPSALDNRPLSFEEFQQLQGQTIYVSATPGPYELELCGGEVVELIVRPTGLVDPEIEVKPIDGQIDDLIEQIRQRVDHKERVLVMTLTKRTAEELTDYLRELGINVRYLHSEIDAIERVEILRALRRGDFDVLVGINLLREGLDLPEVSLVAILDADKEGFLRSTTSLIQIAGRAARNVNGKVILYADVITDSIKRFIEITNYRRQKQLAYNKQHGITPRTVYRKLEESLVERKNNYERFESLLQETAESYDIVETIKELEQQMFEAAERLEFEKAALLRDQIRELQRLASQKGIQAHPNHVIHNTLRSKISTPVKQAKSSAKKKKTDK